MKQHDMMEAMRSVVAAGLALQSWLALAQPPPRLQTLAELEAFVFPPEADRIADSIDAAFAMVEAGGLVTVAASLGPGYASAVAARQPDPEFKRGYRDLARYLDLFGPCQKRQMGTTQGWWSSYPDPQGKALCTEATKLVFGSALRNQVHYCRQLVTGEAKPKTAVPEGKGPPWRLDEPPVKTHWLKPAVFYALADSAITFRFQESLRKHAAIEGSRRESVREACRQAAAELEREPPSRELVALALGKLLIHNWEALHLDHLERLQKEQHAKPEGGL